MISRIIKVKVCVILRSRKLRWITQTENCFNTVLLYIQIATGIFARLLANNGPAPGHGNHSVQYGVSSILVPRALLTRGATRGSGQIQNRIP